ncbi:MAG: hypothetical protein K9L22_11530, partial [Methylococcaceae bacterium]|nr:hypothetical protein [Methylococcaceae bacterium]
IMDLNKNSESSNRLISIMGILVIFISMVANVQADGSIIPNLMILLGLGIVLFAEKSSLNEGPNS